MAIYIIATFELNRAPVAGLSPTITIYDLADNSVVVNAASMSEVGSGGYKYLFSAYDATKNYFMVADAATDSVDNRYAYAGDALTTLQVNAEVLDVMNVDTHAEPGQGAPAATTSIFAKINYLYKRWRNKYTETEMTSNIYNDAGDTIDQKATLSDDGTTFTKSEYGTGA